MCSNTAKGGTKLVYHKIVLRPTAKGGKVGEGSGRGGGGGSASNNIVNSVLHSVHMCMEDCRMS